MIECEILRTKLGAKVAEDARTRGPLECSLLQENDARMASIMQDAFDVVCLACFPLYVVAEHLNAAHCC